MNAEPSNVLKLHIRRLIDVDNSDLASLVTQSEDALIKGSAGIFQRGGQLVRIARLNSRVTDHGIQRSAGSVVIMPVTPDYLMIALSRVVDFRKSKGRGASTKSIHPPKSIANALLAACGEWMFPMLMGIVTAPTLRADASLLNVPGYDESSALFAMFEPTQFPRINEKPSRHEAEEALDLVHDLFGECAFSGGERSAHAAVPVAASITACVRFALDIAPAFSYSAPKQGSGKTVTGKVAAQLATGQDPPVISPPDNESEFRKALLAILVAGDAVVLIDNVAKPIDSTALCAALTSKTYSDRILGLTHKVTVPTSVTWLLTGNSIEFVGDLTSRVLLSVLDPEMEHPEARPFKRNLGEYVLANRGELVRAALTIPLAYAAAGYPKVDAPRSRFSEWDRLVRYPLIWLGVADPLSTQADLRSNDPVREQLVALMVAWRDVFGTEAATVADAMAEASRTGQSLQAPLLDALMAVAGEKGDINNRRLGRYLKQSVRRIENGMRLEAAEMDRTTKRPTYRVSGVSGVSGVISIPSHETVWMEK